MKKICFLCFVALLCISTGCTSKEKEDASQSISLNTLDFDDLKLKSSYTDDYEGFKNVSDDAVTITVKNKKTNTVTDEYIYYKANQPRLEHKHVSKKGLVEIICNTQIAFIRQDNKLKFSKLLDFTSSLQSNTTSTWDYAHADAYSKSGKLPANDLRINYSGHAVIEDESYISKHNDTISKEGWSIEVDNNAHKNISETLVYEIE